MNTDGLTLDACEKILKSYGSGYKLCSYNLKPFCEDVRGFLGCHLLLTLEVEFIGEKKSLTFFVKWFRQTATGLTASFPDQSFFEKEVFAYKFFHEIKKVVPEVDISILPKLYLDTPDGVIVLDNLGQYGYFGPEELKITPDLMYAVLETLATFHAVSLAYEEYKSNQLGRRYEVTEDYQEFLKILFLDQEGHSGHLYTKSCENGALMLLDLIYGKDAYIHKEQLKDYIVEFLNILNRPNKYRKVVSHGDLWAYNMLFKYENGKVFDCKLIDFQLLRYTPPAHDVTMVIYMASTSENYKEKVHDYLEFYYDSLGKELSRLKLDVNIIVPKEEYEETCRIYLPVAKFIWLCYRQTSQADKVYTSEAFKDPKEQKSIVIGQGRGEFVKYNYEHFDEYKENLVEIVKQFVYTLMYKHITIEDCYKLISEELNTNQYEIIKYDLSKMPEKYGFLGDHYFLKLVVQTERDNNSILNYFIKMQPMMDSHKNFVEETGATYKEEKFFRNIIPEFLKYNVNLIQEAVPTCFIANSKFILMENLRTKGYVMLSSRNCLDLSTLKLGLKTLAKLHASGIIFEEKVKDQTGRICKLNELYPNEFSECFYTMKEISVNWRNAAKKGLAEQIRMYSNYSSNITPKQFYNIAEDFINDYMNLIKPSTKYRNTINHADSWANNILFKLQGPPNAILVDFQSYRYCPPTNDLMQYLYFNTDRHGRSKYISELKDFYYNQFKKCIEEYNYNIDDILSYSDFLESCEYDKKFAITQTVTHFQNVLMSEERTLEFFSDPEFARKAFFEDRTDNVRINSEQDPIYRGRCEESIMDLREICEEYAKTKFIK